MQEEINTMQFQIHALHVMISEMGKDIEELKKRFERDQKDVWKYLGDLSP